MSHDVLLFALKTVDARKKVALVTVTGIEGSSPASVGQIMAIASDGSSKGTVGGGASEHQVIKQALNAMESGASVFKFSYDHADAGMTCGGKMEGIGNILGARVMLYIFGGGHIAQRLAKIAVLTGFTVVVVEDRAEFASVFDDVEYVVCQPDEYEDKIPISSMDYAVICTRGHLTDADALRYCMARQPQYIGMVGSARKVSGLFAGLKAEGVPQERMDKIYTPVGLDIASEIPAEIAVAILAEILLVKNKGKARHKRSANSLQQQ